MYILYQPQNLNAFMTSPLDAFWNGDYVIRGTIYMEDLEQVFAAVQDGYWEDDPRFQLSPHTRSMCTGDILLDPSRMMLHTCESVGWSSNKLGMYMVSQKNLVELLSFSS